MGKYFHIVVKGINGEYIFQRKEYIERYKLSIRRNLMRHKVRIIAYCIMNNHAHMLIYADDVEEISKFMQKINTSYAKFYNKVNEREGYVFQGRYYVQIIKTIEQLYNCIVYIHRNPIKANMVKKFKEYKYSSYNEFFGCKELISERVVQLLNLNEKNYRQDLITMHRQENIDDIYDIKEYVNSKKVIENYETKYHKNIYELIKDKKIGREIIIDLNIQCGMSIRKISEKIGINKNKVNKILKEYKKEKEETIVRKSCVNRISF